MRFYKRTPFLATAASVAVLAVAAVADAQFATSDPQSPSAPPAASGLASVPAKQAQAFGVLRQSPVAPEDVTSAVRQQIATGPEELRGFGLDLAQVRAVSPSGRRFYVAPTKKGVCLFLEDATTACTQDIAWIAKYGFQLSQVPAGTGQIVTYGIVGDGVTSVVGHTTAGQDVSATIEGNAYVMVTDAKIDVTQFGSARSSWTTADAPRPTAPVAQ
jgi:hypothetical protein